MKKFNRYLVTSALPYANGPVHIGHLAGVYVPSDIYVRYLRLKKQDVVWVCGSDEHGVPITIKAKKEGIHPQQVVDKYHNIIKDSFEKFGISFDIYSRTSSKTHYATAAEFFRTIYDKGGFIEKESEQYFDESANQFLADRYITGTCPKCGADNAYGDQCEKCGSSLSPTELINPKSAISGNQPVMRTTKHWYLPLDQNEAFLKEWILEGHKEWKVNVYGQCKSWIDQGLLPRAVSRDLDWGVPVPVEGAEGKVLYVWFDAPIGYISATKDFTPDWEKYWKQEDTKLVHFIGKDNIVFHCIVFPAMLKAEGSYILPENVPSNEFLNLENDKISTSRNWAVWLHEYLEDFPGQEDVLRYVLTANAPETKDNDFTWKDFQGRNNSELVAVLGNFANRSLVLTDKNYGGIVPEKGILTEMDTEALAQIAIQKAKIEENIETYHFREALKELMNLARVGNKYITDTEPWKLLKEDPERAKTSIYVSLQITTALCILMEPFLPFTAKKLANYLQLEEGNAWDRTLENELLPSGHQIGKPGLLFAKIEDAQIAKQLEKLEAAKKANLANTVSLAPAKETTSFDDFQKMDIRMGTILTAEKIKGSTKLLKLTVDVGLDQRTIVSGIAEKFAPEQVIGKQVCVLVNLAPRKLKGVESQGMILMAENAAGELEFLVAENKMKNGSDVR